MRGITITACALVVLVGGVAIVTATTSAGIDTTRGRPAASPGRRSRLRSSHQRGLDTAGDGDTIIGPLRFNMKDYSPPPVWRRLVRDGQWMKSVARVRAGGQVTLVVPHEQRPWMRLAYAQRRGGTAAVTLRACRHRRSRAARRRECVWTDYTACRSGPTFFSGGFEIDYGEAPAAGPLRRADRLGQGRAGAAPRSTASCRARRVRRRLGLIQPR